ncbi:MAG: divalent metal cation transporter, partial [Ktedonobacteraceae bacterium]
EAARFNLVIVVFLLIAFVIGSIGFDPLQLALFASTVIALFLPISLLPFLVIMNDSQYLGDKINGRWANIAVMAILLIAFIVAIVSIPLELLTGGG